MGDTADRLLQAATELFSERGYGGTSARAIAERAGVAKPLVFYHWGNKEALRDTVLERTLKELHEHLHAAVSQDGSPRERVMRVFEAYVEFLAAHPAYPNLLVHELADEAGRHDVMSRHNEANLELIRSLLIQLGAEPGTQTDPTQIFLSFVGMALHSFTNRRAVASVQSNDGLRRTHLRWMATLVVDAIER